MMKWAKIVALNIAWVVSALLSSCESEGGDVDPAAFQGARSAETTRAQALDFPIAGDSIGYDGAEFDPENLIGVEREEVREDVITTAGDSVGALLEGLKFTENGRTDTINDRFYLYEKTDTYRFEISRQGAGTPELQFRRIVDILLGGGASLATEFRALILRDEPDFDEAEVVRLKAILNASGAEMEGDTVDNLFVIGQLLYTHEVTSTQADQFLGTMGGVYRADVIADRVGWRLPTDTELSTFRFLNPFSQIPYVTGQNPAEFSNSGTWIMSLVNTGGAAGADEEGGTDPSGG